MISDAPAPNWRRSTPSFIADLPVLDFPFQTPADIFIPASTVLRIGDSGLVLSFLWCFLTRKVNRADSAFEASSLSEIRVEAMPSVLGRLSSWFRFRNSRPQSVRRTLSSLGLFLTWADSTENEGRFEAVLSNPHVALEALRGYHSYLRARVQNHQLQPSTAGWQDQDAIACLSEIHGRVFKDEIEPLSAHKGSGTEIPEVNDVQSFASTLQAIFDSASEIIFSETNTGSHHSPNEGRSLRISSTDDSKTVQLATNYSLLRLTELACVAFAGLAFVDSGANLSVLREYEEPEDLENQLTKPTRINLSQKVVKFRAGGRVIEVHLSATTITRLRTYLRLRQSLVNSLAKIDIAPMFVQCEYATSRGEPIGIRPLDRSFLSLLRKKVTAIGATLPDITLRQLRAYKQQEMVRRAPISLAAKLMGHSVPTAIKAYSKAQAGVRQTEMRTYLDSLQKTVQATSDWFSGQSPQKIIPIGSCADHGRPVTKSSESVLQPDCNKIEGCFFCDNYRVHADEDDLAKLFSCRRVLGYIVPLTDDTILAEKVYAAVVDRIDSLLVELKRLKPDAYEAARLNVEERGLLTRYWANKLQQLHLLGMLPSP